MAKITISYRRDDSMDITGRIFDRLASRYGRESVFRDIDNIAPGLDFREHIRESLADSDALVVVVGPRWMGGDGTQSRIHSETDYVRIEVEMALGRGIPVIPLLVGGSGMPEPNALPESIRDFAYRNAMDISSGRDFDHHMNGLIRATDGLLRRRLKPPPLGITVRSTSTTGTKASNEAPPANVQSNLFFQGVGAVMLAQEIVHTIWFGINTYIALQTGALAQMMQGAWAWADMIFGVGGLIVGIGTIRRQDWARAGGIVLCALVIFAHTLWFVEFHDQEASRIILFATAIGLLLAPVGAYLYMFHWPVTPQQRRR